mmetsp:Transcript_23736/g.44618  ORF Transcript_23736/g.44618 Transcript_23736/m.44618 type:complete len:352 (-) Transcript_23736:10-1065(-)
MAKHLPLNNLRPMLGPLNNRRRVELRPLRRPRRLPHWRVLRPLPPQPTHKPRSLPRLLRHHPPHVKNRNRNLLALRRRPHLLVLRRLPLHLHRHPPPPLRLPRPQPPHAFRGWRPRPPLLRRRSLNTYRSRPRSSSRRKGSHVRTWPVQKKKSSPIHVSTRALLYISHTSRVHFVPLLVVAATVGLLIADSLNSQNFLLNGLAVGFASNIDDLISFLIVSEAERQDVEVMIESLLNSNDVRRKFWLRNRLFGMSLAVVLVSCVVWCEELMAVVGNEGDQKGFDGMRPCSDVLDVAERVPMLLGIIWFVVLKYQENLKVKDKFTDMLKGAGALAVVAMMGQVGMFLHFGIAA